jgi:hypothetical protein
VSIADHPGDVTAARSWRCPECRTLQAATTRCWRCQQPAFGCGTCHFYRPSVAAGLGTCAQDTAHSPLAADEIRSCWELRGAAGSAAIVPLTASQPPGLFAEDQIVPPAPRPSPAPGPTPAPNRAPPRRAQRQAKPPLEDPGRAAWVEPESDALVEAPTIEPGKRLSTEVQRRRRRWFR